MPVHHVYELDVHGEFAYAPITVRPGHYAIFFISLLMCLASRRRYNNPEEKYSAASKITYTLCLNIFFQPWFFVAEGPVSQAKFAFVVVSTVLNVAVLHHHATNPHHPKFKLSAKARFWIGLHISSGVVEWVCSVIALIPWTSQSIKVYAKLGMATAALCGHVPSSFALNYGVAGSRAIMIPSYGIYILVHAFCAFKMLIGPESNYWFANTVIMFNTYVWVRVYGFCFLSLSLFEESMYSAYVILAGLTTMAAAFGEYGPLFVVIIVLLASFVSYLSSPTWADWLDFSRERSRSSTSNKDVHVTLRRLSEKYQKPDEHVTRRRLSCPYKDASKSFFDLFAIVDPNGNRVLPVKYAEPMIGKLPQEAALHVDVGLTYIEFLDSLWKLDSFRQHAGAVVAVHTCKSDRDEAEYVFNMMFAGARNNNEDWVLCKDRLALLLSEWNIPAEEVQEYFELVDTDGNGHIDFQEFYEGMRDVWKFIYNKAAMVTAANHCPCSKHAGTAPVPNAMKEEWGSESTTQMLIRNTQSSRRAVPSAIKKE